MLLGLAAACAGGPGSSAVVPPEARAPAPRALSGVHVLEATGGSPSDTTVSFTAGSPRVIVMRHPAPDYSMFAEVAFDSSSFSGRSGAVEVTVRPLPGVYGIELETGAGFRRATVTFKYAVHFLAPAGARNAYGSDIAFERALYVARLDGETATFLPSTRPATDNLAAVLTAPGSYLVAAPRLTGTAPAGP